MALFNFGYRNDDSKFLALKEFKEETEKLLASDCYLSRRSFDPWKKKAKSSYEELATLSKNGVLSNWCKNTKSNPNALKAFLRAYETIEEDVKKHNAEFLSRHLESDKEYLDHVLDADNPAIKLDEDQRNAVLADEDYTLLIAGAGAGKTTTIEAKAKYLVEKRNIDPAKILVISFTKKATQELKERFDKLKLPAEIRTFHSIGNSIICQQEATDHSIVGPGFLYDVVSSYLQTKLQDESFMKKILLFFASYLEIPFDQSHSLAQYQRELARDNVVTLRSELAKPLDAYKQKLTKNRITWRAERVRSIQECQIANFLFVNGIDYEYEPTYPYRFLGSSKPYTPDFFLKQGNHVAYLEHFGVSEDGKNWRYTPEELARYQRCIQDKKRLHEKHGTELLCTYSSYRDGRDFITHLREELIAHGFQLETRSEKEIYRSIVQIADDRYFNRLSQLTCNFINRFKTNHYPEERFSDFKAQANINKDARTSLFLDICHQCYLYYEQALKEANAIDFEDMINNAADALEGMISRGEKLPYDYIFIDEYQDISFQRFNLAEKLGQASNAKIVAVGDDWQSIYRFSGSDITLFTDFEKRMGYANVQYLRGTHRNSQELIDIAGSFVMENPLQKKKALHSAKHIKDPVVLVSYDDSPKPRRSSPQDGPYYHLGEAIEEALSEIVDRYGDKGSVLLIGRYNFDGKNLARLSDFFSYNDSTKAVISKKYPSLPITFLTAHSSKGLGFDNVIVINGKDDVLGFPSKIEDDPVMKLVLHDAKEIDYAEERRLFYVALTRTKNRVYIIAPIHKPSAFILEIRDHFKNIILNGPELSPEEGTSFRWKCPVCGYPLQRRTPKKGAMAGMSLWVCSNDPEVCGFVTNDLSGGPVPIQKCPKCEDGYLIIKKVKNDKGQDSGRRILGCTNYRTDGTGCDFALPVSPRYSDLEGMSRNAPGYRQGIPLKNCILCGYPIKVLLLIITRAVEETVQHGPKLGVPAMASFLCGEKSKVTIAFDLDSSKFFGVIDPSKKKLLMAVLDALKDEGYLEEEKERKFPTLRLSGLPLDEDLARRTFELFVNNEPRTHFHKEGQPA